MRLDDYIVLIRQLVKTANTSEALEKLLEMGKQLEIKAIEKEAIIYFSQLTRFRREMNLALLKMDEFNAQLNRINLGILSLLEQLEDGNIMQSVGNKRDKGRVIHNIPSKMGTDQEFFCSVRIAKDDVILLKNFQKPDDAQPEDIELSRTMEVSLVDPSGGQMFAVRQISPIMEQTIQEDTFTEWDFMVKPLQAGRAVLILYVFFIEKIDGQKEKRSVSLKRNIEVTTEKVAYFYPWELTNITVEADASKKKRAHLAGWSSIAAKVGLCVGLIAVGIGTYMICNYFMGQTPPPPALPLPLPPSKVVATLKIQKGFQVTQVRIDGNTINDWKTNADTSLVILPPLEPSTFFVEVLGKKGICSKQINLKEKPPFKMDCPQIVPDSFNVIILSPIKAPSISLDGLKQQVKVSQHTNAEGNYPIILKVITGFHTFSIDDINRDFSCTTQQLTIQGDTTVIFPCTKNVQQNVQKVTVKILIPNPLGDNLQRKKVKVVIDKSTFYPTGKYFDSKGMIYSIPNVSIGIHTFKVTITDIPCTPETINITEMRRTVTINCDR